MRAPVRVAVFSHPKSRSATELWCRLAGCRFRDFAQASSAQAGRKLDFTISRVFQDLLFRSLLGAGQVGAVEVYAFPVLLATDFVSPRGQALSHAPD